MVARSNSTTATLTILVGQHIILIYLNIYFGTLYNNWQPKVDLPSSLANCKEARNEY